MYCMFIHQAGLSWERKTILQFFYLKKVTSRLTEILWERFCSCCVFVCFLKIKPKASLICPPNQKSRLLQTEQEVMIIIEFRLAGNQGAWPLSFLWSMQGIGWGTQVKPGGIAVCIVDFTPSCGQRFQALDPQLSTAACIPSQQSGQDPAFLLHPSTQVGLSEYPAARDRTFLGLQVNRGTDLWTL